MRKLLNFIGILLLLSSCTIRPNYFSGSYQHTTTFPVATPAPLFPNPYIYRPYLYPYPYPRYFGGYYNPIPRTNNLIIITPPRGNHFNNSGPRGGRRK